MQYGRLQLTLRQTFADAAPGIIAALGEPCVYFPYGSTEGITLNAVLREIGANAFNSAEKNAQTLVAMFNVTVSKSDISVLSRGDIFRFGTEDFTVSNISKQTAVSITAFCVKK